MSETRGWKPAHGIVWKDINGARYCVIHGAGGWTVNTTNWRLECASEADAKRAAHRHAEENR